MIIGNITQTGNILDIDQNQIGYQWSENLQLKVTYDSTFVGWSKKWDAISASTNSKKRIPLHYDDTTMLITLNKDCFADDLLYLACAFVKDGAVANTSPLELYIADSVNHGLETIPNTPGLYDEMRELFEQILDKEYRIPMSEFILSSQQKINEMLAKADGDLKKIKTETENILNGLRTDYANYIDAMTTQYATDKAAMLADAAKQIQSLKNSTNAAIDTMIKNANTDLKALKDNTSNEIDALKTIALTQQMQIDVAKQSMDTLQADLIAKRDSGFFNGPDGTLIPTDSGMFTLFKRSGHLIARVLKGSSAPPLIHKNGRLYYLKVKEV